MNHLLDVGHYICQTCVEPDASRVTQLLSELTRQYNELRKQVNR